MNPADLDPDTWVAACDQLIHSRQHIGPRRLLEPGPDETDLRAMFRAAAAAPDHERLRPWRFLVLGPTARARLGQAFADALRERDAQALPEQLEEARAKAHRAPVLVLAVADLRADNDKVPALERLVSLGAALQNLLLAAHARGWGCGLSSGRALQSPALRAALQLAEGEHAASFVSIGTSCRPKGPRERPAVDDFVRWI